MPDHKKIQIELRRYHSSDCPELARLFYETVHSVNRKDYAEEQLAVWADGSVNLEDWDRSFTEHFTIVASAGNTIVGFGDISAEGYLDRLYVHKDFQGQGIASIILNRLESHFPVDTITTHASITAKPFFLKRGYRLIQSQRVRRGGQELINFIMKKGPTSEKPGKEAS